MTEKERSTIYFKLADAIGTEGAEFLMTQSPPGGWEQFATKADLKELAAEFKGLSAEFKGVSADLKEFAAEVTTRFAESEVRTEQRFAEFGARMEQGFAELKSQRSRDVWSFVATVATIVVAVVLAVAFIG